jgi:hypothetical protein
MNTQYKDGRNDSSKIYLLKDLHRQSTKIEIEISHFSLNKYCSLKL